jgi:hypothetical protein
MAFTFAILATATSADKRVIPIAVKYDSERMSLEYPHALCIDDATNLFVAMTGAGYVARIDIQHNLSVYAGLGARNSGEDGLRTKISLRSPTAICIDHAGTVFVGDGGRIAKITSDGLVRTLAVVDPIHAKANTFITGLAVDDSGNVYAADGNWWPSRIFKIRPEGKIQVLATLGKKEKISSLCLDNAGNVYVGGDGRVLKIPRSGKAEIFVENPPLGPKGWKEPRLGPISALCFDQAGNLLLASGSLVVMKPDKSLVFHKDIACYGMCLSKDGDLYLCRNDEAGTFAKVPKGTWENPPELKPRQKAKKK